MVYLTNYRKPRAKRNYSGKKFTQVEKTAYYMGQVKRGLTNPNSRVTESFQNGCCGAKTRKPLF